MKILVFGASGGTGQELVEQGLAAGHEMTAFVRDPVTHRDIKGWISRSDLAEFMLQQVGDDTYVRAAPGLSY